MSVKAPRAGRVGKEWTTAEPDNEIKLVFDSQGLQEVLPALAFHLFNAKLGFCLLGWFVNLSTCMGFPKSKYDSESFELELNGIPGWSWWHLW